jgi:hypothetical protein
MADTGGPELNLPEVVAAVTASFLAYDAALLAHDADALDGFFLTGPLPVRFGVAEEQYGAEEISRYRRSPAGYLQRGPFTRYDVVSIGTDAAVVNAQFTDADTVGRQSQTWIRTADGWRVLTGHVSVRPKAGTE